jgi:FkbM family methyltransferase
MNWLAWLFRNLNSRLITMRVVGLHKTLKLSYGLSKWMLRKGMLQKSGSEEQMVLIKNFDSDLQLKIDRSRTIGASIYWTGFHEFRELLFLHDFLKEDMVLLDVGANVGEYTLFAAKRLLNGKVISFEPMPTLRGLLDENIRLNNFQNVKVWSYGLSDREGSFPIYTTEDVTNEGLSTFFPSDNLKQRSINVEVKTLDRECENLQLDRLDFIKMDIEGSELKALHGAHNTIKCFRPLIMIEISDVTYQAAGYTTKDISAFFTSLSYLPFQIDKRGRLQSCSTLPVFGNIIYVPQ